MERRNIKVALAALLACIFVFGSSLDVRAAGALTIALSSSQVAVGDSVTVTVYANGADNNEVTTDMTISYDASKLEFASCSLSNYSGGGGTINVSGSKVDIKFKAIASGTASMKATGVAVTGASAPVTVSGNSSSSPAEEFVTTDDTTAEQKNTGSGDNSLSSLKLSAGTLSPAFKGSTTQYTAEVGSDVSDITVTPVPSNAKALVSSITGNTGLKEGKNTIKVVVEAENGSKATYTIVVNKTAKASAADTSEPEKEVPDQENSKEPEEDSGAGGSITIDGTGYEISEEFSAENIPEHFTESIIEYGGENYKGIMFEQGQIGMLYLRQAGTEKSQGEFFVYDAAKNNFYPFIRLDAGEHFIILMVAPDGNMPPENYQPAVLDIDGKGSITAYQYQEVNTGKSKSAQKESESDTEGVESTQAAALLGSDSSDTEFYLVFAIDGTGTMGWYQYDKMQGTYQRLNEEALSAGNSDGTAEEGLLENYNNLNKQYKSEKTKSRRTIAILIFLCVVLVIVAINLFLRGKGGDDEDWDDEEEEKPVKKPVRKPMKKESPQRTLGKGMPRETNMHLPKEPAQRKNPPREGYYEEDDEEAFAEFEEEPHLFSRNKIPKQEHKAKKEKEDSADKKNGPRGPGSGAAGGGKMPEQEDDDDIEFLDLNDL